MWHHEASLPQVWHHEASLVQAVFVAPVLSTILTHILGAKFQKSSDPEVAGLALNDMVVKTLIGHIVKQKFEQRAASGDVYDRLIRFLSGEQQDEMSMTRT